MIDLIRPPRSVLPRLAIAALATVSILASSVGVSAPAAAAVPSLTDAIHDVQTNDAEAEAAAEGVQDDIVSPDSVAPSAGGQRLVGKLVLQNRSSGSKAYVGVGAPVSGRNIPRLYASTSSGAAAIAGTYTLPAVGQVGPITGTGTASTLCATPSSSDLGAAFVALTCNGSASQDFQWRSVSNSWVSGYALYPVTSSYNFGGTDVGDVMVLSITAVADVVVQSALAPISPFELREPAVGAILETRSVPFSGIGQPGATITARTDSGVVLVYTTVPQNSTSWSSVADVQSPGRYTGTVTQSGVGQDVSVRFDFTRQRPLAPGASIPRPTLYPGQSVEVEATFNADAGGQRIDVYQPNGTRITAVQNSAFSLTGSGMGGTLPTGTTSVRFTLRANDDAPIGDSTDGRVTYGATGIRIADFSARIVAAPVAPSVSIPSVTVLQGESVSVPVSFNETATGATEIVVPGGFEPGTATGGFVWDGSLPGFRGTVTADAREVTLALTAKADAVVGVANGVVRQSGTGLEQSWPVTFEAAPVAPIAPLVVESPGLGDTVREASPVFRGTAQPGSRLEIRGVSGDVLGSIASVASDGRWSITWNKTLRPGRYVGGTVRQFVVGAPTQTFIYDFTIEAPNVAPLVVTSPRVGETITDTVPVFTGTGQPGARIEIRGAWGDVLGFVDAVDASGAWSITWNKGLLPNRYAGGTVKQFVNGIETQVFVYDFTLVQSRLVVTSPEIGGTITGTRPVFTGTANPGATVRITGAWGTDLGTAIADERTGAWTITWPQDYRPGRYSGGTVTERVGGKIIGSSPYDFTLTR